MEYDDDEDFTFFLPKGILSFEDEPTRPPPPHISASTRKTSSAVVSTSTLPHRQQQQQQQRYRSMSYQQVSSRKVWKPVKPHSSDHTVSPASMTSTCTSTASEESEEDNDETIRLLDTVKIEHGEEVQVADGNAVSFVDDQEEVLDIDAEFEKDLDEDFDESKSLSASYMKNEQELLSVPHNAFSSQVFHDVLLEYETESRNSSKEESIDIHVKSELSQNENSENSKYPKQLDINKETLENYSLKDSGLIIEETLEVLKLKKKGTKETKKNVQKRKKVSNVKESSKEMFVDSPKKETSQIVINDADNLVESTQILDLSVLLNPLSHSYHLFIYYAFKMLIYILLVHRRALSLFSSDVKTAFTYVSLISLSYFIPFCTHWCPLWAIEIHMYMLLMYFTKNSNSSWLFFMMKLFVPIALVVSGIQVCSVVLAANFSKRVFFSFMISGIRKYEELGSSYLLWLAAFISKLVFLKSNVIIEWTFLVGSLCALSSSRSDPLASDSDAFAGSFNAFADKSFASLIKEAFEFRSSSSKQTILLQPRRRQMKPLRAQKI